MKIKVILLLFILLGQYSCKENNETILKFSENNKKIEDSNENRNIKNESFLDIIRIQAEKDNNLIARKQIANQVHRIGDDFYKYISDLKIVIKNKNSKKYVNELFFNGDDITSEGQEFLMNIKNYRDSMNKAIGSTNPLIIGMVNNNFNTSVIEDRRGLKTNWLALNFKDLDPIVSITELSRMQSDIRRIETQYLAALLGVKLNSKKKIIEELKQNTDKQISENTNLVGEEDKTVSYVNLDSSIDNNIKEKKEDVEVVKEEPVVEKKVKTKPKEVKKIVPKTIREDKPSNVKKYHIVKSGENMYRISLKYKTTISNIQKLNGMNNNNLVRGQKLRVK